MSTKTAGPHGGRVSALAAARLAAGLTQEELAERAGISVRAISDIERGRVTRPRRRSLEVIADALNLRDAARQQLIEH